MEKLKAAVYGFITGDALGVPYEFQKRDTFKCEGMSSGGIWGQLEGTWSDDSSMLLATCASLKDNEGKVVLEDIMERFCYWYYDSGFTAGDEVFDIGNTTRSALEHYKRHKDVTKCGRREECSNGNGALMRILPLAFTSATDKEIERVSALTHAHRLSFDYCKEYVHLVRGLKDGKKKEEVIPEYIKLLRREEVKSSGFVEDTFQASLWAFYATESYKECVLSAVNLGEDTDTIGAIAGALAGLYYGYESIPKEWIFSLRNKALIEDCLF